MTASRSAVIASWILAVAGAALLATGIIHLYITPSLYRWFGAYARHSLPVIGPPFLLNHAVVGVLLIALGATTCIASSGIRVSDRRAWWISLVSAGAVAVLPLLLVVLMQGGMYNAPPFVVAEILVTFSATAMIGAVIIARPSGVATRPASGTR